MDFVGFWFNDFFIFRLNIVFCLICFLFWYVRIISIVIIEFGWFRNYFVFFRRFCIIYVWYIYWLVLFFVFLSFLGVLLRLSIEVFLFIKILFLSLFVYKLEWYYIILNMKKYNIDFRISFNIDSKVIVIFLRKVEVCIF